MAPQDLTTGMADVRLLVSRTGGHSISITKAMQKGTDAKAVKGDAKAVKWMKK